MPTTGTNNSQLILSLSCPDQPGIIHAISKSILNSGGNITESHQFTSNTKKFFIRTQIENITNPNTLKTDLQQKTPKLQLSWNITPTSYKPRTIIMVSKEAHCLNDILFQTQNNTLPIHITAIVSNHPNLKNLANFYQIPFHHIPLRKPADNPETGYLKIEAENKLQEIITKTETETVILARYMQILSSKLCEKFKNRIINIHHSFLPSFKGAKPYEQAHTRGVKLIGATAHYVTSELDEGPIIEQEVIRVSHTESTQKLVQLGRYIEAKTLTKAINLHAQQRIIVDKNRTIIFD